MPVESALRQPCRHPPLPARQAGGDGRPTTTVGAVEAFASAADTELEVCSQRHEALLAVVDAHNALVGQLSTALAPKPPWWRFWGR